ncbi:MAG: hypothetical protein BWZ02_00972 [Lentisphaerae bacterium ADurb.BinA184]|nr:MAG: hypothetical protein BWZ02_00972 [Lentisphaerae bacterium ADurb.BinA184]
MLRRLLGMGLALGVLAAVPAFAAGGEDGASMTAEEFLLRSRRPFHNHAWGRFRGTVQNRAKGGSSKRDIAVDLLINENFLRAQVVFDPDVVYRVTQAHGAGGLPTLHFEVMPPESRSPLKALGLRLEDVTFFVLYWNLVEELPGETVRGQACRVMRLRNPQTFETVKVSFSTEYMAPLRAEFYPPAGGAATRVMEFTDFERQGNLWYIKSVRIEGPDWKTQIKFTDATIADSQRRPPPDDLFGR